MRKIKNFKINIRPREISRILRKLLNVPDLSIDIEESVQRACFFYGKCIKPAVVYETFSKESMICSFDIDTPNKWIAVSPYVLTIGNSLQEEFDNKQDIVGEYTTQIVAAISADTLEQSKNFVQKLITSEASDENCELSRHVDLPNNLYQDICKVLPIEKINVILSEDGKFEPAYSTAGLFYWIPLKKRSKK